MYDACRDPKIDLQSLTAMQHETASLSSQSPALGEISIRPCGIDDLPSLATLTAPGLTGLLGAGTGGDTDADSRSGLCHLSAWVGEIPAGLLLSRQSEKDPREQELISLMVLPLLRRQGLATRLLSEWRSRMGQAGRTALVAQWSDHLPRVQDFSALLAHHNWAAPRRARLRMSFHVSDRHEALPWAARLSGQLEHFGIRIVSLADLMPAQATAFEENARLGVACGEIPSWAAPDRWLATADRPVSQLLVKTDGCVLGWLLCQPQPALQRWTVPIGWVSAEVPVRAALVAAMARLLERLEAEHGPQATLTLQPSMGAGAKVCTLLDRRFRPHALWADRLMESSQRID